MKLKSNGESICSEQETDEKNIYFYALNYRFD
jgi:hypothetical protein